MSATNADAGYVTGRVTFDVLPDEILLDIFDFYRMGSTFYPWMWLTLAHVCPRWRRVVFESPRRLDLQLLCRPRTRVKELLDYLPPAMPIMISNAFTSPTLSLEDWSQIIAAIEQRDRVWWIHLQDIPSALWEKLAAMMQETFPTLKYVRLWVVGEENAPVLPEGFLGGSAPGLETFWLSGIPFPEVSRLLLSTNDLINFVLERIPDSGYVPPEAMIAALTTCANLEMLVIEFLSDDPHPSLTGQEITSLARVSLPALTYFNFYGNGGYFDNFAPRIESPLLARDNGFNGSYWQHDTSLNRHVSYEASFTPNGFLSRYSSRPLLNLNPVPEEE